MTQQQYTFGGWNADTHEAARQYLSYQKHSVGPFGEQLVGYKVSDISVQFQYDYLNTDHDVKTPVTTGDGVASVSSSLAHAVSASSGTCIIESKSAIRYRPGHSGYVDFTASFNGSGVGYAGGFDDEDGFPIKYDGSDGSLWFGYRRGGTDNLQEILASSLPNGFDPNNLNIYRIMFGYLGVANPVLFVKYDKWQAVSTYEFEGLNDSTHVLNPVFPIRIEAHNGMTVKTGSWDGGTFGDGEDPATARAFAFPHAQMVNGVAAAESGSMTLTSTNVGTIVIFHCKSTYKSKTNKVKARLLRFSPSVRPPATGEGVVVFSLVSVSTLSGAATYADVDANNSVVEIDHTAGTGASVSPTAYTRILTERATYAASQGNTPGLGGGGTLDAERLGAIGYAGDTFAIIAKDLGGNGVTVDVDVTWEELF